MMRRYPASLDQRPGTRAKQQQAHLRRSLKRRACSSVRPTLHHLCPLMCHLQSPCGASMAVTSRPDHISFMANTIIGIQR